MDEGYCRCVPSPKWGVRTRDTPFGGRGPELVKPGHRGDVRRMTTLAPKRTSICDLAMSRICPQAGMRVAPNSAELLERSVRALWEHANPNRIAAVPIPAMSRSVTDIGGRNATGLEVDMKWPAFAVTLAAV